MSTIETREQETENAAPDLTPFPLHLQKILVPTDFSEDSYVALRYALSLAKQFNSAVLLVHIIEPIHPYPVGGFTAYPADLTPDPIYEAREEAGKLLAVLRNEAIAKTGVSVETVQHIGRSHDQIMHIAQSSKVDLIVISTHGRTGLKHILLGSTTEQVVRTAPCPVLVLRSKSGST